jgi:hypothetical protein
MEMSRRKFLLVGMLLAVVFAWLNQAHAFGGGNPVPVPRAAQLRPDKSPLCMNSGFVP